MRCLLLHPVDDPWVPACLGRRWDRVIDLGIAGPRTYESWAKALACPVEPCPGLEAQDFAKLHEMFDCGLGHLVDRHGLDWWDLLSIHWLDPFEQCVRLRKLLPTLRESDEIFVSCAGAQSRFLKRLVPGRVFDLNIARGGRIRARLQKLSRLTVRQTLRILADKYDGSYRFRGLIAPQRKRCGTDVVLMPSAYENATRTAFSYAASLPDLQFVLVAVRQSGWGSAPPANVKQVHLASYADARLDESELGELLQSWEKLGTVFSQEEELAALLQAGCFASMPSRLREGLLVRDSWLNVFASEDVRSVLTADEKSPYTRLPVLLAQKRGIPAVACHHGALDGRYRYSDVCADRFLAKGPMEADYLERSGYVSGEKVFVAAPPRHSETTPQSGRKRVIVFFSEPYEACGSRTQDVFAELVPPLLRIAAEHGCELIVKLHPFESLRDRRRIIKRLVPSPWRNLIRLVVGPLSKQMAEDIWFSVTVSSTAAVDSAIEGVPSFLCTWLDCSGYGYSDQFVKFGAARALYRAEEISDIPAQLNHAREMKLTDLWHTAEPEVLRELLLAKPCDLPARKRQILAEKVWA